MDKNIPRIPDADCNFKIQLLLITLLLQTTSNSIYLSIYLAAVSANEKLQPLVHISISALRSGKQKKWRKKRRGSIQEAKLSTLNDTIYVLA